MKVFLVLGTAFLLQTGTSFAAGCAQNHPIVECCTRSDHSCTYSDGCPMANPMSNPGACSNGLKGSSEIEGGFKEKNGTGGPAAAGS